MGDIDENSGTFAYEEDIENDFQIFQMDTSEVRETIK